LATVVRYVCLLYRNIKAELDAGFTSSVSLFFDNRFMISGLAKFFALFFQVCFHSYWAGLSFNVFVGCMMSYLGKYETKDHKILPV
jgi:hypothetical protein